MKKTHFLTGILFVATLAVFSIPSSPALASSDTGLGADKEWSVTVDLTYSSKYIWRGLNFNDDGVVWPSVAYSWNGFSASLWASIETSDYNVYPDNATPSGDITEVDYTFSYTFPVDKFSFTVGLALYEYPTTGLDNTMELFAVASYDTYLSPTISVYQDVDEAEGTWISLSASHSFDLWTLEGGQTLSLTISGGIGFGTSQHNEYYFGLAESSLTDLTLHATLPFQISETWCVTLSFNYATLLDSDNRQIMAKDDNFWTTLSITATF